MVKCNSCDKEKHDCVRLNCPNCKSELYRCKKCRNLSIEYKCKCGFVGP